MEQKKKNVTKKYFLEIVSDYLESNTPQAVMSKILLMTVALGGVLCVGAMTPSVVKAMKKTGRIMRSLRRKSVSTTLSRFKRDGLIYMELKKGIVTIQLTEKGRKRVLDFIGPIRIRKPFLWDKKWRVVVFDIPVRKNREHAIFRSRIKALGFQQMQKSVWVFPYKCEDEVLFFAKELRIENTIEIFTVQKMIHEKMFRKRFNL